MFAFWFFYTAYFYIKSSSLFYCIFFQLKPSSSRHTALVKFSFLSLRGGFYASQSPLIGRRYCHFFFLSFFFFFPLIIPRVGHTHLSSRNLSSHVKGIASHVLVSQMGIGLTLTQTHVFDGIGCMLRLKSFHDNLY